MHFDLRIDPRQSTAASHITRALPDRLPLPLSVLTGALATLPALPIVIPRIGGLAPGLLTLAGPPLLWRRRRDRISGTVLGLRVAGVSIAAVYLPVHIEPCYLLPLLAIAPLLAAATWLAREPAAGRVR